MRTSMYATGKYKYADTVGILLKYNASKIELERLKNEKIFWAPYADHARDEVWEYINTMHDKVKSLLNLRHEIEQAIDSLEDTRHRLIMRLRYIDGMCWEDISEKVHYEYRWVLRLHRDALKILSEKHFSDVKI